MAGSAISVVAQERRRRRVAMTATAPIAHIRSAANSEVPLLAPVSGMVRGTVLGGVGGAESSPL
jgi:hypothetical protein